MELLTAISNEEVKDMHILLNNSSMIPIYEQIVEQLNGNIHYQMFCDVIIDPTRPLTNYKLLEDIMLELAGKMKASTLKSRLIPSG